VALWGNMNNSGIPVIKVIDYSKSELVETIELDLFENSEEKDWIINDVIYYNHDRRLAVLGRCC